MASTAQGTELIQMPEYPYYPMYPKDLNSDHKVLVMDNRTYGVYRRLLDVAWHEEPAASLPDDEEILAAYARETLEGWRQISKLVLNCFELREGRWWQKRLRREWEKVAHERRRKSDGGKMTAEKIHGSHEEGVESNYSEKAPQKQDYKLIHDISIAAYDVFGRKVNHPSAVVRHNIGMLLANNETKETILAEFAWWKEHLHLPYKPTREDRLTSEDMWTGWRQRRKDHEAGLDSVGEQKPNGKPTVWALTQTLDAKRAELRELLNNKPVGTSEELRERAAEWDKSKDGLRSQKLKEEIKLCQKQIAESNVMEKV